ncbi:putative type IV pilin [Peptoniphilus sp. ING2-D1G]|nr:putative type IV pilin [Peptoniphilus sp. ING2-D1G]
MKRKIKAFTLVELVIVIAIILILVSVAIPRFTKSNLSAQAAAHNVNVKEIKNAAILYLMENENATSVSMKDLEGYFEGKTPKPAKAYTKDDFTITLGENQQIKVTPGMLKVEGDKLVLTGED